LSEASLYFGIKKRGQIYGLNGHKKSPAE